MVLYYIIYNIYYNFSCYSSHILPGIMLYHVIVPLRMLNFIESNVFDFLSGPAPNFW